MSTPPQPPGAQSAGPPSDDRTRHLRRPSLPAAETVRQEQSSPEARQPDPLAGQPTDKLSSLPHGRQRTLTFGAPGDGRRGPAASGSPFPDVAPPAAPFHPPPHIGAPSYGSPPHEGRGAPTRGRRWPWVVLVLLPILVIAVSGVLLFLLLGGA